MIRGSRQELQLSSVLSTRFPDFLEGVREGREIVVTIEISQNSLREISLRARGDLSGRETPCDVADTSRLRNQDLLTSRFRKKIRQGTTVRKGNLQSGPRSSRCHPSNTNQASKDRGVTLCRFGTDPMLWYHSGSRNLRGAAMKTRFILSAKARSELTEGGC